MKKNRPDGLSGSASKYGLQSTRLCAILVILLCLTAMLTADDRLEPSSTITREHGRISLDLTRASLDLAQKKAQYLEKKRQFESPGWWSKYIGEPIAHGLERDMNRKKALYEEALTRYRLLVPLEKKTAAWQDGCHRHRLVKDVLTFIDDESNRYENGSVTPATAPSW